MSQPPGLLVLEAPRRGKPPRHLTDMSLPERREAVAAAGLPAYRAEQVSNHWFGRLVDDPDQWTDIPADLRRPLAASLCPPLLTRLKDVTCDDGLTVKSVWRLHDNALVESVLMRYPATRHSRAGDDVRVLAGRLRHELPVLRDWSGRPDPQSVDRRDRRAGAGRSPRGGPW